MAEGSIMAVQGNPEMGQAFVAEARKSLAACHERVGHCLGQLDDSQVWSRAQPSLNSIGNILLHLSGNLWQWIVSGVGGTPDRRDRPQEFAERRPIPKAELLSRLGQAVAEAEAVLARIDDHRLLESRRIQGFDATVLSAIWDSLTHLAGHTQEIVYMTRLLVGDAYKFAWVPRTAEQGAPREASR